MRWEHSVRRIAQMRRVVPNRVVMAIDNDSPFILPIYEIAYTYRFVLFLAIDEII
jgi:hypothetical protein